LRFERSTWWARSRTGTHDEPALGATPPGDEGTNMSSIATAITHWLPIVRGEFLEVPGLHLTKPQVRRLWGLDSNTCDALLDTLVDRGFLRQTNNGTYARVDAMN
jgi:hypothetical protein